MGVLHRTKIDSVVVNRTLSVIHNPNRYRSKAAVAFTSEILPQFTNLNLNLDSLLIEKNGAKPPIQPPTEAPLTLLRGCVQQSTRAILVAIATEPAAVYWSAALPGCAGMAIRPSL